jgi:hypothetical protein
MMVKKEKNVHLIDGCASFIHSYIKRYLVEVNRTKKQLTLFVTLSANLRDESTRRSGMQLFGAILFIKDFL